MNNDHESDGWDGFKMTSHDLAEYLLCKPNCDFSIGWNEEDWTIYMDNSIIGYDLEFNTMDIDIDRLWGGKCLKKRILL